jgi:hypothetical protein
MERAAAIFIQEKGNKNDVGHDYGNNKHRRSEKSM